MKDIAIWRVLTAEPPRAPDEVLATLRELAAAPAPDRLPLAGAAIRWLSDPHPEIRLLALEALAGAEGNFVVRRVAALLEDPELSVRKAATRVFCQAVRDTPLLWIVALFSPDSEVRAVAREHPPCAEADYLLGYFLFDEPIAPEVEARLLAARFPPPALLLFLRLFKKGRVPGRVIFRALLGLGDGWLDLQLEAASSGPGVDQRALLKFLLHRNPDPAALDPGGTFWSAWENFVVLAQALFECAAESRPVLDHLCALTFAKGKFDSRFLGRLAVGILAESRRRAEFRPDLLAFVIGFTPVSLGWSWIPAAAMREALVELHRLRGPMALKALLESDQFDTPFTLTPRQVGRLLRRADLCWLPNRELHLPTVGRLLALLAPDDWALAPAARAFGSRLAEAVSQNPQEASSLSDLA